jgi:poly(3-hydroxybutyrate) depolymerase
MHFLRRFIPCVAVVALCGRAASCGAANVSDFINFSTPSVPGRMFVPPEATSSARPLILFLHGAGETGTNNISQINPNIDNLLTGAKARGAFLYAPQATTFTWGDLGRTTTVMSMIDQAITQYNVDADRVYVTGLSMGGGGVWNMLNRFPDRFAAGVPIAAVSPNSDFAASNLVGTPTWAFHARNDGSVSPVASRQVVSAILSAAGTSSLVFPSVSDITTTVRYANDEVGLHWTEWSRGGHGIWGPVFNMSEMYNWMFSQTLAAAPPPIDPAANGQIVVNNINGFLPIADPTGVAIPAGTGFMAVGSIGLSDAEVAQTTGSSLSALAHSFTQFGASLPLGVNGLEGLFAADIGAPLDDDDPLLGQNIYLVVGDGGDIETSDSLFIFKSDLQFASGSPGFHTTIALDRAIEAGEILLGTRGTVFANRLGGFRAGIIAAAVTIPEPTALALCSVALVILTKRRRPLARNRYGDGR